MSKPATTTVFSCRPHVGWCCAALWTLTLLPSAVAVAAAPDPALRRSEQLDIRRLDKVSENERSVLRVEWRSALAGADEARIVQELLDSLRRMEGMVAEISRLIRNVPAQKAVAVAAAEEPSEFGGFNSRLALANLTAAGLVALWWFRRRSSAKYSEAKASLDVPPTASPPVAPSPLEILPTAAPPVETPVETPPADPPKDLTPVSAPSSATQKPAHVAPAAERPGEVQRIEPRVASEAIKATPAPTPVTVPTVEPTALPKLAEVQASAPLAAEAPMIDFSLEEADPEVVARENARLKKRKALPPPEVPEEEQKTNVDPTLQLAEIMLSMGLEQGAAQALLEYTEANPRQAVYHWLKLLGIYRKQGRQKEFTETAEKLRQHFNIQAADWVKSDTGETPTLEGFARVSDHVQQTWAQPAECLSYLQHLLEDNREGARAGFPLSVAEEILWLIEILKDTSGASQAPGT